MLFNAIIYTKVSLFSAKRWFVFHKRIIRLETKGKRKKEYNKKMETDIHLKFISKNLKGLPPTNNTKMNDEKLCQLFEEVLCRFHQTGLQYLDISLSRDPSRSNYETITYLKCSAKGEGSPVVKMDMDINSYNRLCEIILCYGVFYTSESINWHHGLILAEGNSRPESAPYDFTVNFMKTVLYGYSITIRSLDKYKGFDHKQKGMDDHFSNIN